MHLLTQFYKTLVALSVNFMLVNLHLVYRYFDYLFYVDFEASMADQIAQNALRHLKVHTKVKYFEAY